MDSDQQLPVGILPFAQERRIPNTLARYLSRAGRGRVRALGGLCGCRQAQAEPKGENQYLPVSCWPRVSHAHASLPEELENGNCLPRRLMEGREAGGLVHSGPSHCWECCDCPDSRNLKHTQKLLGPTEALPRQSQKGNDVALTLAIRSCRLVGRNENAGF